MALGTTSKKRGVYCSHPVLSEVGNEVLGVVVVKTSLDQIENRLGQSRDEIVLVTGKNALVFIANKKTGSLNYCGNNRIRILKDSRPHDSSAVVPGSGSGSGWKGSAMR